MLVKPKVSVLMTTYNQGKFIAKALESVLQQDYDDFELIISDDASTDNTTEIIDKYCNQFQGKIKLFKNSKRIGITGNSQRILDKVTGEFVAFIAGDDIWLPGKLSAQITWFDNNPNAIICYHDTIVFDVDKQKVIDYYKATICGFPKEVLFYRCFAAIQSIMIKSTAIPLNGYNQNIPNCSDWFLVIESLVKNNGYIGYIEGAYAYYVKHNNSTTRTDKRLYLEIINGYKQCKQDYPSYIKQFDLCLAEEIVAGIKMALINKDLWSAKYCLKELFGTASLGKALYRIINTQIKKFFKKIFIKPNRLFKGSVC